MDGGRALCMRSGCGGIKCDLRVHGLFGLLNSRDLYFLIKWNQESTRYLIRHWLVDFANMRPG